MRTAVCIIAFVFSSMNYLHATGEQQEYEYLDQIALSTGADKSSNCHNYTEIYAKYFSPLKDKPIKFLEIGIDQGASVKLWEEYFKNAELHFIDITFKNIRYFSERSKYHLANQENLADLAKFISEAGGDFDIIIDDGGHTMSQQINSFSALFPHVKSGGMYIIEDLHTSYWKKYGGNGSAKTTIAFLKGLIDEVNFVGARTGHASHAKIEPSIMKELNIYREKIYSMHFYDSTVIIIKR